MSLGLVLFSCTADSGDGDPPPGNDGYEDDGTSGNTGNTGGSGNTGNTGSTGGTTGPTDEECKVGTADCDGVAGNGCETDLTAPDNCGACGHACDLAHAESACDGTAGCVVTSCEAGFADCDDDEGSGCERSLAIAPGACASGADLGSLSGDTGGDATTPRNGTTSEWVHLEIREDDSYPWVSLSAGFQLTVPDGVDYDVILWDGCGGSELGAKRTTGMGQDELLCVTWADSFASTDTREVWVEVRYSGGSTCAAWTLTALGNMDC